MYRTLLILAVAVLAVTTLLVWQSGHAPFSSQPAAVVEGEAKIGGTFALVDQHGKKVKESDFRGRLMLVYFGFTSCPDICPVGLAAVTQALEALGDKAGQVAPIFISVDPVRDTPPRMREYASRFHKSLVALTGSEKAVKAAAEAYRVYYAKAASKDGNKKDYTVDHSGFIYLMDRQGKYLKHFSYNASAADIADALKEYVQ